MDRQVCGNEVLFFDMRKLRDLLQCIST